ncbi:MAG: miaA [Bacteroidetes bacterium]|nr:miaA [Bacteroidota bacterium]
MKNKKYLIVIAGPTAIGKTALGIELAQLFHTTIISADSRQFFREMSIGTAKPSPEELKKVQHYFINSHSITENYNVGKYETEAIQLLDELFTTKDIVIMVGGSGLYIDAVCKGFDELPEANETIREKINTILETEGITALQNLLLELDPVYHAQVDLNNPQRLSRALEVCFTTGKPYSTLREGKIKQRNFNTIKIGLTAPRELLYARINNRVDDMMKQGLLEEVRKLQEYKNANALQTVGYKELFDYLDGKISLQEAVALIKQNTRRFAKRQLTWFKRDPEMKWFEPQEPESIVTFINQQINHSEQSNPN